MSDNTTRRQMMVDTQIRPSDVTKFPIINAMLRVPREAFVPDDLREAAYVGEHLPLGQGRVVMDPRVMAKMLDAIDVQDDELVLDVGCGLGYSSALLSNLGQAVIALEEDEDLSVDACTALEEFGADNVILHQGRLLDGCAEHGPYDVIILQGSVHHFPDSLADQLKHGGRVGCLFSEGAVGQMRIGSKTDGQISWRTSFDASAPVLPGFEKHHAFSL